MPKMKLLHRIFWNAIQDEVPDKVEELAKPFIAQAIQRQKEKHGENFPNLLKGAYYGLMFFNEGVRESPNEFDDAGLDIFLDPLKEAAEADGITL